jgi:hypothetical protein
LAWFVITTVACIVAWLPMVRVRLHRLPHPLVIAATVAVIARLVPALISLPANALVWWDIDSYRAVASAISHRHDVYDITGRYPYLPFHMYVFAAAAWLSAHTPLSFLLWVKLPAIAADALITGLIGVAAAGLGQRRNAPALAFVFALNPVSVLVTGYHGQFDAVPAAVLLLAWVVLVFRRERWALPLSALLLGLAVVDKTWPVVLAPVLLWRVGGMRRRAWYATLAAVPAALSLVLYEALVPGGAWHALETAAGYQGVLGVWGYSEVLVRVAGTGGQERALHTAREMGPSLMLLSLGLAYAAAAHGRRDADRLALVGRDGLRAKLRSGVAQGRRLSVAAWRARPVRRSPARAAPGNAP